MLGFICIETAGVAMAYDDPEVLPSDKVAAVRKKLFAATFEPEVLAAAQDITLRTVSSYVAQGMPCIWIGRKPYPKDPEAIEWIRSRRTRQEQPPPPRGRGRPRKPT